MKCPLKDSNESTKSREARQMSTRGGTTCGESGLEIVFERWPKLTDAQRTKVHKIVITESNRNESQVLP